MPRQTLTFPEFLSGNCVLLPVPIEIIPHLGGLLQRWEWKSQWVTEEDWAQGEQLAIDLQEALVDMDCTNQIVEALNRIEQALMSLNVCCAFSQNPDLYWDSDSDSSIVRGDGEPPAGFASWSEYDDYLCQAAQAYYDEVHARGDDIFDIIMEGAFVGIEALAVYLAPLSLPVTVLLLIMGVIVDLGGEEMQEQWNATMNDARQDVVCAIFNSLSVPEAKVRMEAAFATHTSLFEPFFFMWFFSTRRINELFNGETTGYESYSPAFCTACPEPLYGPMWEFLTHLEGWTKDEGKSSATPFIEWTGEQNAPPSTGGSMHAVIQNSLTGKDLWVYALYNHVIQVGDTLSWWNFSDRADVRRCRPRLYFTDETGWSSEAESYSELEWTQTIHDLSSMAGKEIWKIEFELEDNDATNIWIDGVFVGTPS